MAGVTKERRRVDKRPTVREAQADLDSMFRKFDNPEPVHLISAGGTIEFEWDRRKDGHSIGSESLLPVYVRSLQPHTEFSFGTACQKDSRDVNQKDRRRMLDMTLESPHKRVLIAHGCFTIPDTAEYLLDELPPDHGKTVVLFGSRDPLKEMLSEGPFNLGFATAASSVLDPGVYIAMEGRLFNANEVMVDKERRFREEHRDAEQALDRLESIFGRFTASEIVHMIRTGGTIESRWEPTKDTAVVDTNPWLQVYVERMKLQLGFVYTTVCLKDSRDISYRDRKDILRAITTSDNRRIIIPHGTYTMPDTGQFINEKLPEDHDRTVVLFGSMIPLNGFVPSDAPFNLGFATGAVLVLEPGVYLGMNTRIFNVEDVGKNREKG